VGAVTFPKGIFITADDPQFLESQVEPDKVLVDLEGQNIAELRAEYIRRQRDYFTTPFDPEGHKLRLFPGGITIWSGLSPHGAALWRVLRLTGGRPPRPDRAHR
jgi:hypothetical protein